MKVLPFFIILFFLFPFVGHAALSSTERAQLEQQLAQLEQDIANQQTLLDGKTKERASLERDVAILDAQIQKAKLQVRATTLSIQSLNGDIAGKESTIGELGEKLSREKQSLAQILRKTNEVDEYAFIEIMLSKENMTEFYKDLDAFSVIQSSLHDSFIEIQDTKSSTEEQKATLLEKRTDQIALKNLQLLEQQAVEKAEKEKQALVKATKGQEAIYQSLIKQKQLSAAQIRAELFGLRDSAAIPFGTALAYAQKAGAATGVRPALILGILKQETSLGKNVGTGTWTSDMHPTRDVPVFKYIAGVLGFNPDTVPVSKKPSYGWGGAMGPSQFIPSTWVCYGGFINTNTRDCNNVRRTYTWDEFWKGPWEYVADKDKIRALVKGNNPSDPWVGEDAFMATGLLMKENGADAGTRASERLAALRYFAGWTNATKKAYAFYGDSVMQHADFFETQIAILNGS